MKEMTLEELIKLLEMYNGKCRIVFVCDNPLCNAVYDVEEKNGTVYIEVCDKE